AQILTFMWRAAGSPSAIIENPFTDVKVTDYYYKAALWAYSKGMVSGILFAGDTPCTRSATVVYLWKNADSPATSYRGNFSDVSDSSDYAQAVAWAVENGVTLGTSETTFSPNATCTRGQIVTFLKRALR
ncbi:MAG: S-layer homology domain-containing protein, partial [Clostridia bacterium]|nr:S-layer homology domain-containing protein [Clostridia bacterium]